MTLPPATRVRWIAAGLLVLAAGSAAWSLSLGSAGWVWSPGVDAAIVWQVRAPRVLAGFGVGAALAVAGALMQLLTRNPLADPYVMGVSGGASVGAFAALWLAAGTLAQAAAMAVGAGLGALGALLLLLALSWRALNLAGQGAGGGDAPVTLLLVGVMIGAACSALIALGLSLAREDQLRGLVFWLMGDLGGAREVWPAWLAVGLALILCLPHARDLDRMARGDAWARSVGVPVARRRRVALVAAAVATGAAVATAGAIGFVGLVVPHVLRLLGVRDARTLLSLAVLAGGCFVVLADTVARTVVAPIQLPVGAIAALVGAPLFIALLLHGGRSLTRG